MGTENTIVNYCKALTGEHGDATSMVIMVFITVVNVGLTSVKAYESALDGSMSIASSALESFGDVFSCFVIGYYRYKEMTADPKKFPHGRSARAQAYNICAYIMISVALGALLIDLDRIVLREIQPVLELRDVIVMVVNVIVKCVLLLICYTQRHRSELRILMMDQMNDVFTNSITIAALFMAIYVHVMFDFLGAILICGWVVRNWLKVLSKNNKRVHGHIVRKEILDNLLKVAKSCEKVDVVHEMIAYYNGEPAVVEVFIRPFGDFHEAAEELRNLLLAEENIQTVHVFLADEKKYAKRKLTKIPMEPSKLEKIIEEDETQIDSGNNSEISTTSADDPDDDRATVDTSLLPPV